MRITFLVSRLNLGVGGGGNHDIFLKIKALQERGHDITLITAFSEGNKADKNMPCKIIEERVLDKRMLPLQKSAVDILKKHSKDTDIFYLVGNTFLFGGGWYRLFSRHSRPVIGDINGYADFIEEYFKKPPLYPAPSLQRMTGWGKFKYDIRIILERSLGVFFMNKLDKVVIMTKIIAVYYMRAGVKRNKIVVIPSFQDIESFQSVPRSPNPFQDSEGKFRILSAGRIYIDKGFDLLIEAFARLGCRDACALHIVGEGEQKEELIETVKKLGLENQIKFYGWQDQEGLIRFLQHADLFVQPARIPEPLNRTAVQAMSLGVSLVVTDTSGDKWVGEEVAKTFANGDVEDLKMKIEEAFLDKPFQERARLNGPKRAKDFDYRISVQKLDQAISSVIK